MTLTAPSRLPPDALRFLFAGGIATGVNWLARFPLSAFLPFQASVAVAYIIGMGVGFVLYSRWVFPRTATPLTTQVLRFIGVNAAGGVAVVVAAPLLANALEYAGASQALGEAAGHGVAILIGAVVNYFGHKLITFAAPSVERLSG